MLGFCWILYINEWCCFFELLVIDDNKRRFMVFQCDIYIYIYIVWDVWPTYMQIIYIWWLGCVWKCVFSFPYFVVPPQIYIYRYCIYTYICIYIYIHMNTYIYICHVMTCHVMSCTVIWCDVMWCNDASLHFPYITGTKLPSSMATARRRSPQSRRTKQRWTWSVLRTADDVDVTFLERLKRR